MPKQQLKRRFIPSFLPLLLATIGLLLLAVNACSLRPSEPLQLPENHWQALPSHQQLALSETDQLVVWQLVSFRCAHCYQSQMWFQEWRSQHPQQNWQLVPMPFANHQALSRTWVAAWLHGYDSLTLERLLYNAIQEQGQSLSTLEQIAPLVALVGWPESLFFEQANSPEVSKALVDIERTVKWLGITQTPAVVVNGQWQLQPHALTSKQALFSALSALPK